MSHLYQHHREKFRFGHHATQQQLQLITRITSPNISPCIYVICHDPTGTTPSSLLCFSLDLQDSVTSPANCNDRRGVSLLDGNRTQGRARTREVSAFGDSNHFAISIHAEEDIEEQGKRKDWRKERRNEGEDMEGKRGASP